LGGEIRVRGRIGEFSPLPAEYSILWQARWADNRSREERA